MSDDRDFERVSRYRDLGALSLKLAVVAYDKKARAVYLRLAVGWNALATEIEMPALRRRALD